MKDRIIEWIKDYADKHDKTSLIVGVSGGIDSAVVSTLCAKTGLKTIPVILSIHSEDLLAFDHVRWLEFYFSKPFYIIRHYYTIERPTCQAF